MGETIGVNGGYGFTLVISPVEAVVRRQLNPAPIFKNIGILKASHDQGRLMYVDLAGMGYKGPNQSHRSVLSAQYAKWVMQCSLDKPLYIAGNRVGGAADDCIWHHWFGHCCPLMC